MKKLFIAFLIVLVALGGIGVYLVMTGHFTAPRYTITILESDGGGNIAVDKTEAYAGDDVVLTIRPEEGYELEAGSLKYGETEIVLDENNKFKMPSKSIVINYKFVLKDYKINYVVDEYTNIENPRTTYTKKSETFSLSTPTKAGYRFDGWYLDRYYLNKVTFIESGTMRDYYLYPKFTALFKVSDGYIEGLSEGVSAAYLEIPRAIDGVTIEGIADEASLSGSDINYLKIHNTLKYFGTNSFSGSQKFETVEYVGTLNDWVNITFKENPKMFAESLIIDGKEVGETLEFPKSIKKVSANAFWGFDQLKYIFYQGALDDYVKVEFENERSSPMYYAKNLSIGGYLVGGEITIKGTTQIYPGAFSNCADITKVNFEMEEAFYKINIGESAFRNCTGLKSVDFDKVLGIGDRAFYNCTNLQVERLSYAYKVGAYAFYNCDSISSLNIGTTGPITIGQSAFDNCSALQTLSILNANVIEKHAFRNCALINVVIKDGLEYIGEKAFANNEGVSIDLTGCTKEIEAGEKVFDNCGEFSVWFANEETCSKYKTAENWEGYAENLFYRGQ